MWIVQAASGRDLKNPYQNSQKAWIIEELNLLFRLPVVLCYGLTYTLYILMVCYIYINNEHTHIKAKKYAKRSNALIKL